MQLLSAECPEGFGRLFSFTLFRNPRLSYVLQFDNLHSPISITQKDSIETCFIVEYFTSRKKTHKSIYLSLFDSIIKSPDTRMVKILVHIFPDFYAPYMHTYIWGIFSMYDVLQLSSQAFLFSFPLFFFFSDPPSL